MELGHIVYQLTINVTSSTPLNLSSRFYFRSVSGKGKMLSIYLSSFLLRKVLETFKCRLKCALAFILNTEVYEERQSPKLVTYMSIGGTCCYVRLLLI